MHHPDPDFLLIDPRKQLLTTNLCQPTQYADEVQEMWLKAVEQPNKWAVIRLLK